MTTKSSINPLGLDPYNGMPITKASLAIDNAGGGLTHRLEVDPDLMAEIGKLQIGDRRCVVVWVDVVKHTHGVVKGDEGSIRIVPKTRATDTILLVDPTDEEWARGLLTRQLEFIARRQEELEHGEGAERLPFPGDEEDGE